jgi:hypothetical protein
MLLVLSRAQGEDIMNRARGTVTKWVALHIGTDKVKVGSAGFSPQSPRGHGPRRQTQSRIGVQLRGQPYMC